MKIVVTDTELTLTLNPEEVRCLKILLSGKPPTWAVTSYYAPEELMRLWRELLDLLQNVIASRERRATPAAPDLPPPE